MIRKSKPRKRNKKNNKCRKVVYKKEAKAIDQQRKYYDKFESQQHDIYYCNDCKGYHLTTKGIRSWN